MHQRLLAGLIAATMAVAACARDSASPTLEQKGPSGASAPAKPAEDDFQIERF